MTNKIEFGAGFTAELRDYSYYITHPNGGGAMASPAEAALIRAVVAARAERNALVVVRERAEAVYAIRGRIFADPILVHRGILAMGRALKHVNEGQGGAG